MLFGGRRLKKNCEMSGKRIFRSSETVIGKFVWSKLTKYEEWDFTNTNIVTRNVKIEVYIIRK